MTTAIANELAILMGLDVAGGSVDIYKCVLTSLTEDSFLNLLRRRVCP